MLILDRSEGERIVISTSDGPITITMLERRRGSVRFGIDAPAKCYISRPECRNKVPRQDKPAQP